MKKLIVSLLLTSMMFGGYFSDNFFKFSTFNLYILLRNYSIDYLLYKLYYMYRLSLTIVTLIYIINI